jgi:hypothetical protein
MGRAADYAFGSNPRYGLCALSWSAPPFAKDGRLCLFDFPAEEIMVAGPRVDLDPANLAAETALTLAWMRLPCCGVPQPAIGTAKILDRPQGACHPATINRSDLFSSYPRSQNLPIGR